MREIIRPNLRKLRLIASFATVMRTTHYSPNSAVLQFLVIVRTLNVNKTKNKMAHPLLLLFSLSLKDLRFTEEAPEKEDHMKQKHLVSYGAI